MNSRAAFLVQILLPKETGSGEPLLRIAYTTDGIVRQGPVTLRTRDIERLREALAARPAFVDALGPKAGGA